MYVITKTFTFEAAHHLNNVPEGHKCRRPHGHSYRVVMELQAEALDTRGFVVDYTDLGPVKDWIDFHWDHQDLNAVEAGVETTAENLAKVLFDRFKLMYPQLTAVTVCETAKTTATYRGRR